jgi:hypothetical protein
MATTVRKRQAPEVAARTAVAELFATHQHLDLEKVADELDRRRRTSPLDRVMERWALSHAHVAAMFGVSRQAVAKWLTVGVPAERATAVADLAAATDQLERHIKRDRIAAVVRRPAPALDGRSLLELATLGDFGAVLVACREMFEFERAML